jgi:hypothetical protein
MSAVTCKSAAVRLIRQFQNLGFQVQRDLSGWKMFAKGLGTISCDRGESLVGSNEIFEWLLVGEKLK